MKNLIQTLFFFLLVTQIGFAQWYQQNSGTTTNLNAVQFIDENTGWAVGDSGTILHTTNAGTIWEQQTSGTSMYLRDVRFVNQNKGWIVGTGNVILHTTNGGLHWSEEVVMDTTFSLISIFFLNETLGWIAGARDSAGNFIPIILKTADGGNNWMLQTIACCSPAMWTDIYFVNDNVGYIVYGVCMPGYCSGNIYKTTNGGETWIELSAPAWCALFSISFVDENIGIVGAHGNASILRTQDGGMSWIEASVQGNDEWCRSVNITDLNHAWAVATDTYLSAGSIWFSSDLGENWSSQGVYSKPLNSVDFISSTSGWAVGDSGIILNTTNGGVSFVEEEQPDQIPTEFLLSQNYPNPFNPSTSIQYQVSSISHVSLVVYDILGNKIETLVSEEKPAGTYQITWNASQLPSGVYFYQLRAGSFVETKKMILLK